MKGRSPQHRLCLGRWGRGKIQQQIREGIMNKSIITVACALIAPVAFAQTSTTTTEQTTTAPATTTTTTSTTYEAGTVETYTPGKTIVVKSEREGGPVSFALGTAARIVDGADKIIT